MPEVLPVDVVLVRNDQRHWHKCAACKHWWTHGAWCRKPSERIPCHTCPECHERQHRKAEYLPEKPLDIIAEVRKLPLEWYGVTFEVSINGEPDHAAFGYLLMDKEGSSILGDDGFYRLKGPEGRKPKQAWSAVLVTSRERVSCGRAKVTEAEDILAVEHYRLSPIRPDPAPWEQGEEPPPKEKECCPEGRY